MEGIKKLQPDFVKSYLPVLSKLSYSRFYIFEESSTYWESKYFRFIVFLLHCIFMSFHINGVARMYEEESALSKISTDLGGVFLFIEGLILLLHLNWSRKAILDYIIRLEANWPHDNSLLPEQIKDKEKIMEGFDKFMNRYFFLISMNTSYYIWAPMQRNIWNALVKGHFTYEMPFYMDAWFDHERNIPLFLFVYVFDVIVVYCTCWMVVAPVWLIAVTIRNLYVMFVIFHHDIRHLVNKSDHSTMKTDMQALIKRHTTLLDLQDEISGPFGAIFAIHIGCLITIIAFYAITAMLEREPRTACLVITCVLASINLLPVCYYGEQLTFSSMGVATAAYDTTWYSIDIKYQRYILLIIYRAQRPTYVTSTFLSDISLITFTNVIKSTWSFLSLMLTLIESS